MYMAVVRLLTMSYNLIPSCLQISCVHQQLPRQQHLPASSQEWRREMFHCIQDKNSNRFQNLWNQYNYRIACKQAYTWYMSFPLLPPCFGRGKSCPFNTKPFFQIIYTRWGKWKVITIARSDKNGLHVLNSCVQSLWSKLIWTRYNNVMQWNMLKQQYTLLTWRLREQTTVASKVRATDCSSHA